MDHIRNSKSRAYIQHQEWSEQAVIPAKAWIQRLGKSLKTLGSSFRLNDGQRLVRTFSKRINPAIPEQNTP
jgi:hypothetical protein